MRVFLHYYDYCYYYYNRNENRLSCYKHVSIRIKRRFGNHCKWGSTEGTGEGKPVASRSAELYLFAADDASDPPAGPPRRTHYNYYIVSARKRDD